MIEKNPMETTKTLIYFSKYELLGCVKKKVNNELRTSRYLSEVSKIQKFGPSGPTANLNTVSDFWCPGHQKNCRSDKLCF